MKRKGFTLLELIIVIIVIGILASIALPQYLRIVEKARLSEGTNLLGLLRSSQMRYYTEQAKYTNNISDLDLEVTTPKYFNWPPTLGTTNASLATLVRNNFQKILGDYCITINEAGNISCTPNATCKKLGF